MGKSSPKLFSPKLQDLLTIFRLLTVGQTVDEAAFLFYSFDQACHSQLLAEAAAANGLPKSIISDHVAKYNADVIQSAVRTHHL
jgi:hypothetical protein